MTFSFKKAVSFLIIGLDDPIQFPTTSNENDNEELLA